MMYLTMNYVSQIMSELILALQFIWFLQVKASLFAAGCFCELSDDFPCVLLEMLVNMITLSETLLTIKVAGARVFAKLGCSYSIASRAYKVLHLSELVSL